ncbi:hypothetical protein CC78DRAFT_579249 [Lojkania enalia]|uniref:Xylanolytic transcriptional activator regulatory domain-containing protein n=1 Tax=Lojkania enalia TaxID=147567 RepID=A0A9P4KBI7_9PLEO|nr:hypothetical protein CC78DRAFT_579249 [Didymosphaeria enalia]
MGPKRSPDSDLQQATKLPKLEHGLPSTPLTQHRAPNNDFSGSVKKKLASSTRTGQACDRCKLGWCLENVLAEYTDGAPRAWCYDALRADFVQIRKIRCDGRPEGCSPCAQNRTPCKTTDRITGRATTRGHVEATEAENQYLRAQIAELQAQLKELGVEPRTVPSYNGFPPSTPSWPPSVGLGNETSGWPDPSQRRTSSSPLPPYGPGSNALEDTDQRPLPNFKHGSIGDNYLGVSSADSLLSHINGTSLSVFGFEIDITDFVLNEEEYDNSVMSYNHFLRVALNEETVEPVPFPESQRLIDYATWYLRSLNPYSMLLEKRAFMDLVTRIGRDPNFSPSPAETVCVHMMLATLKYQISVRNNEEILMEESHKHYRYSLSFFRDLLHRHTWQDVQALTLICYHLRNFPKPGAAWIMCSTSFLLAIELGLHRSTKAWGDAAPKMEPLEIEMRKRVFWTLQALTINLSGKLGRPMPINMEDIDVDFPEPFDDDLPGENTPDLFSKCSFQVGIQMSKYTAWSSELYRTIYAVRQSPRSYMDSLRRLESGLQRWREECPPELADPARASPSNYIFALYLEFWDQEFELLLHHPAVCRSTDPEVINSNLDKCLEASQRMLQNCIQMRKKKSLDIPWINTVVYIAAIFTTLFVSSQRKDQMNSVSMTKLRNDMDQWVDVIGECGQLLGSRDKLKTAIQKIVEHSLSTINESIVKRTATESLARAALQTPQEQQPTPSVYGNGTTYHEPYADQAHAPPGSAMPASEGPYAAVPGAGYSYNNGTSASVPSHPQQQTSHTYDQSPYIASEGPANAAMTPAHAAALAAAASGAPPPHTYANTQVPNNTHPYQTNGTTPSDWRQWTRTFIHPPGPSGDYLNTASTLIALGGREGGTQAPGQDAGAGAVDGSSAMQGPGPSNYQWPGIVFGAGNNGHVAHQ